MWVLETCVLFYFAAITSGQNITYEAVNNVQPNSPNVTIASEQNNTIVSANNTKTNFLNDTIQNITAESIDNIQSNSKNTRIIGGQIVSRREDIPYQVSLRWRRNNQPFCGASIIDNRNLLTAARCVTDNEGNQYSASEIQAVVGDLITTISTNTTVVERIQHIFVHENYNNVTRENDIAILRINNLVLNALVASVLLRTTALPPNYLTMQCRVSGWGTLFSGGPPSQSLRYAVVQLVSTSTCNATYGTIRPTMICAGSYRTGACEEDYGGPLVCNNEQFGIVSWGIGCGEIGFPTVYTGVHQFANWINTTMARSSTSFIYLNSFIILFSLVGYFLTV